MFVLLATSDSLFTTASSVCVFVWQLLSDSCSLCAWLHQTCFVFISIFSTLGLSDIQYKHTKRGVCVWCLPLLKLTRLTSLYSLPFSCWQEHLCFMLYKQNYTWLSCCMHRFWLFMMNIHLFSMMGASIMVKYLIQSDTIISPAIKKAFRKCQIGCQDIYKLLVSWVWHNLPKEKCDYYIIKSTVANLSVDFGAQSCRTNTPSGRSCYWVSYTASWLKDGMFCLLRKGWAIKTSAH